jgi:hypothetical protein
MVPSKRPSVGLKCAVVVLVVSAIRLKITEKPEKPQKPATPRDLAHLGFLYEAFNPSTRSFVIL